MFIFSQIIEIYILFHSLLISFSSLFYIFLIYNINLKVVNNLQINLSNFVVAILLTETTIKTGSIF